MGEPDPHDCTASSSTTLAGRRPVRWIRPGYPSAVSRSRGERDAGGTPAAAWSWLLPLGAALLVVGWLQVVLAATPPTNPIFVDWTTYALGSERILSGESLYLPEQVAGPYALPDVTPQGYIYPPPSALMFLPFSVGPLGLAAWIAANIALLISGLTAVLWREQGDLRPLPLTAVILGLLVIVPVPGTVLAPFPNGVLNANVNVGLAGLLAWCWAAGSRRGWITYAAGAGAAFKLFPGALVLWAVRRNGPRPLMIAIAITAGICLITLPIVGVEEWSAFVRALSNAQPACDGGRSSVACLTQPLLGPSLAKAAGVVVGVALLALAVRVRAEFLAFVLLTGGMLAPLADGHQHYLLFAYVLVVIGLCRLTPHVPSLRSPPGGSNAEPAAVQ